MNISILISLASLGFSIYAFKHTFSLDIRMKILESRKIKAEQFSYYSNLLHKQYEILNERISTLSEKLCETNNKIGNLLDMYDRRSIEKNSGYKRALRHLYYDLHEDIFNSFKNDLPGQTTENIYWRLSVVKQIDPKFDLKLPKKNKYNIFKSKNDKSQLESVLFSKKEILESFFELSNAINKDDCLSLYNSFVDVCLSLQNYLKEIMGDFKISLKKLISGLHKNCLEEFKLQENPTLYKDYMHFLRLLQFVIDSPIIWLKNNNKQSHLPISHIIYIGANISIMNELCCKLLFSFSQY